MCIRDRSESARRTERVEAIIHPANETVTMDTPSEPAPFRQQGPRTRTAREAATESSFPKDATRGVALEIKETPSPKEPRRTLREKATTISRAKPQGTQTTRAAKATQATTAAQAAQAKKAAQTAQVVQSAKKAGKSEQDVYKRQQR